MADKSYPTGGEFLLREYNPQNIFTPEDFNENQRMFATTVQDFVEKGRQDFLELPPTPTPEPTP